MLTPTLKAFNFAREIRRRRLDGSVFKEIEVSSGISRRLHWGRKVMPVIQLWPL